MPQQQKKKQRRQKGSDKRKAKKAATEAKTVQAVAAEEEEEDEDDHDGEDPETETEAQHKYREAGHVAYAAAAVADDESRFYVGDSYDDDGYEIPDQAWPLDVQMMRHAYRSYLSGDEEEEGGEPKEEEEAAFCDLESKHTFAVDDDAEVDIPAWKNRSKRKRNLGGDEQGEDRQKEWQQVTGQGRGGQRTAASEEGQDGDSGAEDHENGGDVQLESCMLLFICVGMMWSMQMQPVK